MLVIADDGIESAAATANVDGAAAGVAVEGDDCVEAEAVPVSIDDITDVAAAVSGDDGFGAHVVAVTGVGITAANVLAVVALANFLHSLIIMTLVFVLAIIGT